MLLGHTKSLLQKIRKFKDMGGKTKQRQRRRDAEAGNSTTSEQVCRIASG